VWFLTGAWPLALLVALLTAAMPRIAYAGLKARRLQRINEQMPDALAMLASALRAGSSLQMGLTLLVNESPAPISQEFSMVLRAQRLGMALEDALEGLGKRLNMEDMDLFVSAMVIAKEVGGNLAEILERLSQTLRTKASMEGKINALTAQGKMQGWVVGLLPLALGAVLYTMDPEAMSPLFTTVYGWAVMGIILVFLLLGSFFIRKIVTIDI
jgi:tight adherence protein B